MCVRCMNCDTEISTRVAIENEGLCFDCVNADYYDTPPLEAYFEDMPLADGDYDAREESVGFDMYGGPDFGHWDIYDGE